MSALLLVDRQPRLRMVFAGAGAKTALAGLVTNDVLALQAGQGQRAAALTPKGRVIALLRIFDRGTDLLVDADAAATAGFVAMIRKYVNPRLATCTVVTDTTGCIGVHGDGAAGALAAALAAAFAVASGTTPGIAADVVAFESLAPLAGMWHGEGTAALYVLRSTDLSEPGFEIVGARARVDALAVALERAGARRADADEVRASRVEAGLPEWGVEFDAETLPQEAALDDLGAISFSKGCYTGQEVVARIHFRGHVNRTLRWLSATAPIPVGAVVLDPAGNEVGDIRSSVVTPRRGPLAIAMIRREVGPGSEVRVRSGGQESRARVVERSVAPGAS